MPLSIVITEDISRRVPFLLLLLLLLTFLPCRVISDSRVWVGVFCRKKVEYFFMLIGSSFFPMVSFFVACYAIETVWLQIVLRNGEKSGKAIFYQKLEL